MSKQVLEDIIKFERIFSEEITCPVLEERREPTVKTEEKEVAKIQVKIWESKINMYIKEEKCVHNTLAILFNIAWGQCSATMKNRLESLPMYKDVKLD